MEKQDISFFSWVYRSYVFWLILLFFLVMNYNWILNYENLADLIGSITAIVTSSIIFAALFYLHARSFAKKYKVD